MTGVFYNSKEKQRKVLQSTRKKQYGVADQGDEEENAEDPNLDMLSC